MLNVNDQRNHHNEQYSINHQQTMFTGRAIQLPTWFKRSSSGVKKEEGVPVEHNRNKHQGMEQTSSVLKNEGPACSPIVANRKSMSIESISRLKKIKLNSDRDIMVFPNFRSRNDEIISWCLTSKPVRNNSCISMYTWSFQIYKSLINQLVPIEASWKIQIEAHVSIVSNVSTVSEFLMRSRQVKFIKGCEYSTFYMQTFEFFEKTIARRTNCYYFITYVKFIVCK